MRTLRTVGAAALVLVALGLVACGGGDPAPASSSAGDGGSGRRPGVDEKTKKAMLAFARCMREHGINMPDPKFDGGGGAVMMGGDRNTTPEQQREAQEACGKYQKAIKPPPISKEQQEKFRKAALENAKCMRDHGVDMPDPQFGENGEVTQKIGPGLEPTDQKFQAAQKACNKGGGLFGQQAP